jgi:hypothetical protein
MTHTAKRREATKNLHEIIEERYYLWYYSVSAFVALFGVIALYSALLVLGAMVVKGLL